VMAACCRTLSCTVGTLLRCAGLQVLRNTAKRGDRMGTRDLWTVQLPDPAGAYPSVESFSLPCSLKILTTRNRSASLVVADAHSLAASGPVISASSSSGCVRNVMPLLKAR
jgi:hypothetical protein